VQAFAFWDRSFFYLQAGVHHSLFPRPHVVLIFLWPTMGILLILSNDFGQVQIVV